MRAKRSHVLITESKKSEQPDSNHDKLFIDVSKPVSYTHLTLPTT